MLHQSFRPRLRPADPFAQRPPSPPAQARSFPPYGQVGLRQGPIIRPTLRRPGRRKIQNDLRSSKHGHPVEAVQTDLIQVGLGTFFVLRKRAAEVLLNHLIDGRGGCRPDLFQIDRAGFGRFRELESSRAEPVVVGDECGRLSAWEVVPSLQDPG